MNELQPIGQLPASGHQLLANCCLLTTNCWLCGCECCLLFFLRECPAPHLDAQQSTVAPEVGRSAYVECKAKGCQQNGSCRLLVLKTENCTPIRNLQF